MREGEINVTTTIIVFGAAQDVCLRLHERGCRVSEGERKKLLEELFRVGKCLTICLSLRVEKCHKVLYIITSKQINYRSFNTKNFVAAT